VLQLPLDWHFATDLLDPDERSKEDEEVGIGRCTDDVSSSVWIYGGSMTCTQGT
jgi:hypothetical protein